MEIGNLQGAGTNHLKIYECGASEIRTEERYSIQRCERDMDQQQREYFLHQQMKTIQEELGGVSYDEEIQEMQLWQKRKSGTKK